MTANFKWMLAFVCLQQSVKDLCTVYMDASDEEKLRFFTILAEKYGVDHDNVTAVATSLASCKVRLLLKF